MMNFSSGQTLTKTKALNPISYVDIKVLAHEPLKVAVSASQYAGMTPEKRSELKKEQKYFITSPAKTRSDKAVKAVGLTGIVLDLDSPVSSMTAIAQTLRSNNINNFVIYTSLSHTSEQPRYRVLVGLAEKASVERWQVVTRYLNDVLFVDSDDCSKTMSQAWLLPVVTVDGEYNYIIDDGEPLDINDDNHPLVKEALDFSILLEESTKAIPATLREFSLGEGEISPVNAYNQTVCLRSLMKQFGYKFKSKNQAVHPLSQSGSAGIYVFPEGNRAYSHHGSDPLCGKSFDAFDLYVQFEHGGDFMSAVKAAANFVKTNEGLTVNEHNRQLFAKATSYQSVPTLIYEDFSTGWHKNSNEPVKEFKAGYDIEPPPEHCFSFAGIAKDIFDNIIKTAIYPQPTFALAATLMILSMFSGGRLTGTQTRVRANLMFICTGDSGSGKQHNINKVEEVTNLTSTKLNYKVKNRFASGPALWNFLAHDSQEMLLLVDECGFLFNSIKNNKGDYLAQLYDCFLQGYSASSTVLKPTVYADRERNNHNSIEYPHICLMGFTTGSTLGDALSHEDAATGLLPRLLFFPAVYDVPEKQGYNPFSFTEDIIEGFKSAYNFSNWKGLLPYTRKYPLHVPTTHDAEVLLDEFGQQNRQAMRQAESMERDLLNRAEENARRLSLVYWMDCIYPTDGQGNFEEAHKIQVEHVRKAIDLVQWSLAYTMEFMTDKAGASITSKEVDRVVAMISQAADYAVKRKGALFDRHHETLKKGIMPRAVLVKLSKKSAKHLDEIMDTALAMDAVNKMVDQNTGKIYFSVKK